MRVAVFAAGDQPREAEAAGADVVGADDLIKRVEGGFLDFDVAIATPDLMGQVGKLGRTLGPRGLMPNPKTGTVTPDIGKAVGEFKAGKVEYRTDRYGNVHVPIGKASFTPEQLLENYHAVLDEIMREARRREGQVREVERAVIDDGSGHQGRPRRSRTSRTARRRPRSPPERDRGALGRRNERGVPRCWVVASRCRP